MPEKERPFILSHQIQEVEFASKYRPHLFGHLHRSVPTVDLKSIGYFDLLYVSFHLKGGCAKACPTGIKKPLTRRGFELIIFRQ